MSLGARAITIWRDRLVVEHPLRKVEVRSAEIDSLELSDLNNQGLRVPHVRTGRPIRLQGLGVDEAELYRELQGAGFARP